MFEQIKPIQQAFNTLQGLTKFVAFKKQIQQYYKGAKPIQLFSVQTQTQFSIALFLSILNKKHQRLKQSNQSSANMNIQQNIISIIDKNKTKILTQSKASQQKYQSYLNKIKNTIHYIQQSKLLIKTYKQQIYQTVIALCDKENKSVLFWRSKVQYNMEDIKRFGKLFGQDIYYLSYENDEKKVRNDFMGENIDGIYLLDVKDRFLYLYPNNKNNSRNDKESNNEILYINTINDNNSENLNSSTKSFTNTNGMARKFSKLTNKGSMTILQATQIPVLQVENLFLKNQNQSRISKINSTNNNNYPNLGSDIQFGQQKSLLQSNQKSTKQQIQTPPQTSSKIKASQIVTSNQNIPQNNNQLSQSRLKHQSSIRNSQVIQKNNNNVSISQSSIILMTKVKCSNCQKIYSQIDCLYWSYTYYCWKCIQDINVDTSHIPQSRMDKFLRQRNCQKGNYEISCPQCGNITTITNYNPAKKNKFFRCNLCTKVICIQHKGNIYDCLCHCPNCNNSTIFLQKLNINFCQKCRVRYCFKCKKKSRSFCNCICKQCLGQQTKQHLCQPACHSCNNKPAKLRECRCGLKICFGCYYGALERWKEGYNFPCQEGQYV